MRKRRHTVYLRIVKAQILWAVGAALCLVSPLLSVGFILVVQLIYAATRAVCADHWLTAGSIGWHLQSTNSTVTPGLTSLASSAASQLVSRTQPWLSVLPIFDGSGVPWMP